MQPPGTETAEIRCEQPGMADFVGDATGCPGDWCGYQQNADVTLTSYAVGIVGGADTCTATFIGPNIAVTAAHCGTGTDATALNLLYRAGTFAPAVLEVTRCSTLVQSLACTVPACGPVPHDTATDTAILHCTDVDLGGGKTIPPGLLFGTPTSTRARCRSVSPSTSSGGTACSRRRRLAHPRSRRPHPTPITSSTPPARC
jgi:hypothetical protein